MFIPNLHDFKNLVIFLINVRCGLRSALCFEWQSAVSFPSGRRRAPRAAPDPDRVCRNISRNGVCRTPWRVWPRPTPRPAESPETKPMSSNSSVRPGPTPRSRVAAQEARVASPWGHPQTTGPPGGKHWPGVFLKMPRTGDHRARGPVVWAGDQYLSKDAAVCWLLDQWQPAPELLPRPSDLIGIAPSKAAEANPSSISEITIKIITILIIC